MSGAGAAADWNARYRAERTPWERPTLNPAFLTWRQEGTLNPCRILVPGAGRSGEPLALSHDGFDVTVVDSAPVALAVQRARLQAAGHAAKVYEADLLSWSPESPFDVIYDQTCLCALPPPSWPAYAARLHNWLVPGGRLFLLAMQVGREGGPPFDCSPEVMRTLFKTGWQWPEVLSDPVPHSLAQGEIPIVLGRI
jgi:hypothetical protein